jgi:alpha-1,2-mannosyltransferase
LDENIYDPGPNPKKYDEDYRYGPVFAVVMSPFFFLPARLGSCLFGWAMLAAFYWVLRELMRQLLPGQWTTQRQAIFLILTLLLTGRMFWAFQTNPIIFAAIAGAAVAIKNQRWWLAVFLLAGMVHIKVWPLAAAFLFMACWPRQLTGRFIVAMLAVGAIPLLTTSPHMVWQQYQWWFDVLFGRAQERHEYRDAWTIWNLIQTEVPKIEYTVMQLSTAVLVLAASLWQKQRRNDDAFLLTFILGLWIAWQMVFGIATERNTFGLIGPLAAWAILIALEEPWRPVLMTIAFFFLSVLSLGQLERWWESSFPWIRTAHPIGSVLFAVWLFSYAKNRFGPITPASQLPLAS